ncbi:MAG: hypothetical protein KF830_05720 [Planctomycetes bacterium]|nr:hypothetical protein [Planctomycetota bacterium]
MGLRSRCRAWPCRWLLALAPAATGLPGVAQEPAAPPWPQTERWLQSDQAARPALEAAVAELLLDPPAGCAWLGAQLRAEAGPERRKGLTALVAHTTLEFVRRQRESGVRFVGQYLPLQPMQPQVGDFLFGLLLDTPDWFPHTHRVRLVPALRDLQPVSPGAPRLGRVLALAEDEEREPEPLRGALACLLWQWGLPELAQQRLDALRRQSTEGDAEDRLRVLLELAELQYELREYRAAAATHRGLQAMARNANLQLKPIDFYQAACAHALAGEVDRALDALDACAALQASPEVDSSRKLERSLFDGDPELAALRPHPRFAGIVARAFPAPPPGAAPVERPRR